MEHRKECGSPRDLLDDAMLQRILADMTEEEPGKYGNCMNHSCWNGHGSGVGRGNMRQEIPNPGTPNKPGCSGTTEKPCGCVRPDAGCSGKHNMTEVPCGNGCFGKPGQSHDTGRQGGTGSFGHLGCGCVGTTAKPTHTGCGCNGTTAQPTHTGCGCNGTTAQPTHTGCGCNGAIQSGETTCGCRENRAETEKPCCNDGSCVAGCGVPVLAGFPLAMAYVPIQEWDGILEPEEALAHGTMFCGLVFPWYPSKCHETCGRM